MILRFTGLLMLLVTSAYAQEYVAPDWVPPDPPPYEEFCGDQERVSEPVIAYGISGTCELTNIRPVGEYQYGTQQVRSEVEKFSSNEMVRRFVSGTMTHFREISVELHKANERPATLICTVDMLGKNVYDAKIIREKALNEFRTVSYDEPVTLVNNQLPDLGVFTYSRNVTYTVNNCSD